MIAADGLVALFSAGLMVLLWLDVLKVWHVFVIIFARALGGTFHFAAMQASTSLMVPKSQLSRAGGMNQTLRGIMNIITPPLGALLMGIIPLYAIMGLDVLTAAFAIVPLFFVSIPHPKRLVEATAVTANDRLSPVAALWSDVAVGFTYIWHWPGLFIALLMATLLNMMTNSAWGIGLITGGLALSVWAGFRRKIDTSLMGLGFLIVGLVPSDAFWVAWGDVADRFYESHRQYTVYGNLAKRGYPETARYRICYGWQYVGGRVTLGDGAGWAGGRLGWGTGLVPLWGCARFADGPQHTFHPGGDAPGGGREKARARYR